MGETNWTFSPQLLEKKFYPLFLTTLLPVLIILAPQLTLIEQSDLDVSVMQLTPESINSTKLLIVIQNFGNEAARDTTVTFSEGSSYTIKEYFSLDGIEVTTKTSEFNDLILSQKRMSPDSYTVYYLETSPQSLSQKTISVASDDESIILTIPENEKNYKTTNKNHLRAGSVILISIIANFIVVFVIRRFLVLRYESIRRINLGKINIKSINWSKPLKISLSIILFVHIVYFFTLIFTGPYLYPSDLLVEEVNFQSFLDSFFKCNWDANDLCKNVKIARITAVTIAMGGTFMALIFPFDMPKLPRYQWFLSKADLSKIKIQEIKDTLITPVLIPIETKAADITQQEGTIFILIKNDSIIGLISKNEIHSWYDSGSAPTESLERLFEEQRISLPYLDSNSQRNNFLIVHSEDFLSDVKNKMEQNRIKFAIVKNIDEKYIGILDYSQIQT